MRGESWFEKLTGFVEQSPEQVRNLITLQGETMHSVTNGKSFRCGILEIPTLGELRTKAKTVGSERPGDLRVTEVVANVQQLHLDPKNANAMFQVASQFNLLEMTAPEVTPESGITQYEYDLTQGPACAIAAGAGTIYRNYFVEVDGQPGQTKHRQLDCLADMGRALDGSESPFWTMRNGYALPSENGLRLIAQRLGIMSDAHWLAMEYRGYAGECRNLCIASLLLGASRRVHLFASETVAALCPNRFGGCLRGNILRGAAELSSLRKPNAVPDKVRRRCLWQ
jgi:hypothetical protein